MISARFHASGAAFFEWCEHKLVCIPPGIEQPRHRKNMGYIHVSSAIIVSTRAEGQCL